MVDPECCSEWDQLSASARERAIRFATQVIWALSGRQFQICTACVRPCKTFCLCCGPEWKPPGWWGYMGGSPYAGIFGGGGMCGCMCSGGCCKASCAVRLDPAPVANIIAVKIDGQIVPADTYQVIDGNLLVRSADAGCWPKCNDLSLPDTAQGTWSVYYSHGTKQDLVALDMAAILACEAAKLCSGQKCRLSGRITQVNRDGVSITLDPTKFLKAGITSIPEIDQWLYSVNPYGLAAPSTVWSPDYQPLKQVTWPTQTC